jgi:hypothetical protein
LSLESGADYSGGHVEKVNQKVVWMLCLDVKPGKYFGWEVIEIARHDHFGTGTYGSGQNMPVVRIG